MVRGGAVCRPTAGEESQQRECLAVVTRTGCYHVEFKRGMSKECREWDGERKYPGKAG